VERRSERVKRLIKVQIQKQLLTFALSFLLENKKVAQAFSL
jgi:hypothetical protein